MADTVVTEHNFSNHSPSHVKQHKRPSVPQCALTASQPQTEIGHMIEEDTHHLMEHFRVAYSNVKETIKIPNVLLVGVTGAGKSSLINSIFGKKVTATGTGMPITQHFSKHEPEDKSVVIFDSKGLETGTYTEFIETTTQFFEEHKVTNKGDATNSIHVIWYVVNTASSRIQPQEEQLCKELFKNIPIMFLLNKADLTSEEDRKSLTDCINNMHLQNQVGIYYTISSTHAQLYTPTHCPVCKSPDIIIYKRKKICVCEECNTSSPLRLSTGLNSVVRDTLRVLPIVAREAFISAQRVSLHLKDKRARRIIKDFVEEYAQVHLNKQFKGIIAKMLTRLSILWEFKEHGHLYGTHIASDLVHTLTFADKIFLFMKRNRHQQWQCVALALIWNRCVRALYTAALFDLVRNSNISDWHDIINDTFSILNDDNLDSMETRLETNGLVQVMSEYIPDMSEEEFELLKTEANILHSSSDISLQQPLI